eukprot:jgi/Mesvir1/14854/Mv05472-RA.1
MLTLLTSSQGLTTSTDVLLRRKPAMSCLVAPQHLPLQGANHTLSGCPVGILRLRKQRTCPGRPAMRPMASMTTKAENKAGVEAIQAPGLDLLKKAARRFDNLIRELKDVEQLTRPGNANPEVTRLFKERWDALPDHVKTPGQMLGRITNGCEGTQGVFPKCTFGCKPCYHSADANRVRIDGLHTAVEAAKQMELLQKLRGPYGHCQLIGGEVSLLPAEDHAAALQVMRAFGRVPMSFSHGDFDYEYLEAVAVDPSTRKRRFDRLDFAVHFDRFMVGRRGIPQPNSEAELQPYREKLLAAFRRLEAEHGVRSYVAHNMTVQPGNLGEVASFVAANLGSGFRMLSFQPAAFQGDDRRWAADFGTVASDHGECVWREIEKGAGCRLPYGATQMGDFRCNRTVFGAVVGKRRFVPYLDDGDARDIEARDYYMTHLGTAVMPFPFLVAKIARALLTQPRALLLALQWVGRFVRRAGGLSVVMQAFAEHGFGAFASLTIVMHRFMDASNVVPAWEMLQRGEVAQDPVLLETQERLRACSYAMAHPELGITVPACVQHSVYDPPQNKVLAQLLPLGAPAQPAPSAEEVIQSLRDGGQCASGLVHEPGVVTAMSTST